jgi:hypothetical protein
MRYRIKLPSGGYTDYLETGSTPEASELLNRAIDEGIVEPEKPLEQIIEDYFKNMRISLEKFKKGLQESLDKD